LVEITGGEPLLQKDSEDLACRLCDDGHTVLIETNGSLDISRLPEPCVRIVDVKCPGSGEQGSFHLPNINELRPHDECKFVISSRGDFDWAREFAACHRLTARCTVLFSPVWNVLEPRDLAEWMIADNTAARFGLQLQKVLWGDDARGR
jgi:7-carboxy-7-deazaguanine synthase